VQKRSPLGVYPRRDAILSIFFVLKTKIDSYVATDRTCERFFGGKLNLTRSEDGSPRRAWYCCSFNAPSTYAFVAAVRRLASTLRVHRFSPEPFQKQSGNCSKILFNFSRVLGGCERIAPLDDLRWLVTRARIRAPFNGCIISHKTRFSDTIDNVKAKIDNMKAKIQDEED
jgi:hypothetical protein